MENLLLGAISALVSALIYLYLRQEKKDSMFNETVINSTNTALKAVEENVAKANAMMVELVGSMLESCEKKTQQLVQTFSDERNKDRLMFTELMNTVLKSHNSTVDNFLENETTKKSKNEKPKP